MITIASPKDTDGHSGLTLKTLQSYMTMNDIEMNDILWIEVWGDELELVAGLFNSTVYDAHGVLIRIYSIPIQRKSGLLVTNRWYGDIAKTILYTLYNYEEH